jgi:beta-lactamase regulating signal transducer with metallopeptidase domain
MILVLCAAWVAVRLDRSHSAATRYRVWLVAIAISAALPVLNAISASLPGPIIPAPLPLLNSTAIPPASTAATPIPGFASTSLVWPSLILLWAAGAILQLIRLWGAYSKLRRIKRAAQPATIPDSSLDIDCQRADALLLRASPVPVVSSKEIKSPGIAGLFRPAILLPADMASWTTAEERASILRHELAHINRHDHLASLFQSVLSALLFFHPFLRYASNQLSLERELACDDTVLGLGTEPRAYAESILKAAERTFITDVIHQAASFAAKRRLERRIDMILDPNRLPRPSKQWPFLVLPLILLGIITWLVMPPASGTPRAASPAPSNPASHPQLQVGRVVDVLVQPVARDTVFIDTVKRGDLLRQVRALGNLKQGDDGAMLAALQVPEVMSVDIEIGQPAAIDTRIGGVSGKVIRIHPRVTTKGIVRVDVVLEGR